MPRFQGIPVDDVQPVNKFGGIPVDQEETVAPTQERSNYQQLGDALLKVPGFAELTEFASGANRTVFDLIDFIGPDRVNDILRATGSETQVPTMQGTFGQERGTFAQGLPAEMAATAGELVPAALGIGQALRSGAAQLPAMARGESALVGTVRQLGQTAPRAEATGSVLAGVGQETGREVGGETGALIGGIVAPLAAPLGVSVIKNAFAGGSQGRQSLQAAIDDFAEVGTTPTVGVGTGDRLRQGFENLTSKIIGGASVRNAFDRTTNAMQGRLTQIADDLSTVRGDVEAGRVISRGIRDEGGFVDRFVNKSGILWKNFDNLIDDTTKVNASNTAKALDDLVNDTELGAVLNNPIISKIKDGLTAQGNAVDYRTFRALRSTIGERLGNNELTSDIPRQQLKRLYGALSEDLKAVAAETSPEALKALTRANKYTAAGHGRIDDFIDRLTNKVDFDKIYSAVTRGGEGIQSINAVKRSLKPNEWEAVASNVVRRMGKAAPGAQDAAGDVFSINKFLTDWNKLGRSKDAIFSGSDKLNQYRDNLDRIARVADRYKSSLQEFANPSGTGQFLANVGVVSGGASSLATGNLGGFGLVLGGVAANSAASRLMTSPTFVKWLAQASKSPNIAGPLSGLANVAKETGEFEAIGELIETIKAPSKEAEAK